MTRLLLRRLLQLRPLVLGITVTTHRRCHGYVRDHYFRFFRESGAYHQTVATSGAQPERTPLETSALSALGDDQLVGAVLSCGSSSAKGGHVHALERECCRRVGKLAPELAIRVMDAWATSSPHCGSTYVRQLPRALDVKQLPWPHLVHLLYLLGLKKCSIPPDFASVVEERLSEFRLEGDFRELAVLCSSLFKLKTRVSNDAFLSFVSRQTARALASHEDRFDVVAALKFLRLCEHYSPEVLENLVSYVASHSRELVVTECAHMLAAFASVAAYDRGTFECLEDRVVSLLRECIPSKHNSSRLHPSLRPRLKDVAKVLWAFAAVNHGARKESLQVAVQFLEQNFTSNRDLYHVLDALQSLICLDCYPWDLIDRATSSSAERAVSLDGKKKAVLRLVFIAASAQLARGAPLTVKLTSSREQLPRRDGFGELVAVFGERRLRAGCILPHIRIAGVTFAVCPRSLRVSPVLDVADMKQQKMTAGNCEARFVSIELLDDSVLVRDSEGGHLRGIMAVKVRQLQALGVRVIGVSPEEIARLAALSDRRQWWNVLVRACALEEPLPAGFKYLLASEPA
uniref:Mediator complex subunit 9 isoform C family protein n=1 Tax=Rhipicephalus zambeziensis TaxID=60191 RepID=A0A224YT26_9ACAR